MAVDALYLDCVLRLHFDGANNSTTFTDTSPTPKTGTAYGNAKISTARPKYGPGAGEFDGAGSYVQFPNSADFFFGSGNFAVSGFFEPDTVTGVRAVMGYANGSALSTNYSFQFIANGSTFSASIFSGSAQYTATKSGLIIGTKHHLAVERDGDYLTAYIDGEAGTPVNVAGVTVNDPSGAVLQIGRVQGYYALDGMLDEIDIVKAVRFGGNFTPPAAALPDYIGDVSGVVYDDTDTPCARTVRLYRRDTGALVGSVVSNASTGVYSIGTKTLDEVQRIVLDDSGGTLYNDIIDRVIPA